MGDRLSLGTKVQLIRKIADCALPAGITGYVTMIVEGRSIVEFEFDYECGVKRRFLMPYDEKTMKIRETMG